MKWWKSYRNWLVRPALFAGVGMTLFGNLDGAQHSWGGYLSHGWAPLAYLITFETLIRSATIGVKRWISGGLVLSIAAVAMVISFNTLRHAAESWGWDAGSAWLFPVIVDLMVIVLSLELAWSKPAGEKEEPAYGATQPMQPGIDWDEEFKELEKVEISVPDPSFAPPSLHGSAALVNQAIKVSEERAEKVSRPRSSWDARQVVEMILAGAKTPEIEEKTGAKPASVGRLRKVTRMIQQDPRVTIDPKAEKVTSDNIRMIRELVGQ